MTAPQTLFHQTESAPAAALLAAVMAPMTPSPCSCSFNKPDALLVCCW